MDKSKLNQRLADSGKAIGEALYKVKEKTVGMLDQNDDGQFDLQDVSSMADRAGKIAKKAAGSIKDAMNDKAKDIERSILQPIFEEDLDSTDFILPKFVRICGRDKKHEESEVCKGAIGYYSDVQELKYTNIYMDKADLLNVTFYPDSSSELYYVDPSDRDRYIALDDYFSYLKTERVNELQKIAQDLGAKHFRVTYKEEKSSFSQKTVKADANVISNKGELDVDKSVKEYAAVEIAAEMEFPGHNPTEPTLHYLQRDPSVINLIHMRMNEKSPLLHQKVSIRLSNSSGIKERDAIKIDAILKNLKIKGNSTVTSEAINESRRILEFEIDF